MSDQPTTDLVGPYVADRPASERLLGYLAKECLDWQVEQPTTRQVAAVLHALADHTAIMAALDYRPMADSPWPHATSMGRWLHDTADQMDRNYPPEQEADRG